MISPIDIDNIKRNSISELKINYQRIGMIVKIMDMHWIFVGVDRIQRKIYQCDSDNPSNSSRLGYYSEKVKAQFPGEDIFANSEFICLTTPKQDNGVDCGIFAMYMASVFADEENFRMFVANANQNRINLTPIIKSKRINFYYSMEIQRLGYNNNVLPNNYLITMLEKGNYELDPNIY